MPNPDLTALDWSDDDLDSLSEISAADIAEAEQAWKHDAPADAKDLLDADSDES